MCVGVVCIIKPPFVFLLLICVLSQGVPAYDSQGMKREFFLPQAWQLNSSKLQLSLLGSLWIAALPPGPRKRKVWKALSPRLTSSNCLSHVEGILCYSLCSVRHSSDDHCFTHKWIKLLGTKELSLRVSVWPVHWETEHGTQGVLWWLWFHSTCRGEAKAYLTGSVRA